jgi:hypothetical protein
MRENHALPPASVGSFCNFPKENWYGIVAAKDGLSDMQSGPGWSRNACHNKKQKEFQRWI